MTKITVSPGTPMEIYWYLIGNRSHRAAKKVRDKNIRKRAGAELSYAVMYTPGINEKDARVIKAMTRRLKVNRKVKKWIFENLLKYKRMNYEAIRITIRQDGVRGNKTHLHRVMIHPSQLEEYKQNYVVVDIA